MFRTLTLVAALALNLAFGSSAFANVICVVDAERALNETSEGKAAQKRLEGMYASKQQELEGLKGDLEKAVQSFESSKMILSDDARRAKEEELLRKQQGLQQKVMAAEQEMQATYTKLLSDMEEKLYAVAGKVGTAQSCSIMLQQAAVIWAGEGTKDITAALITALDGK